MSGAYIHMALRTPRGRARADGGLAHAMPEALVGTLITAMQDRGADPHGRADGLYLGCVGQVGDQGGHIALVSKLAAGLPVATTAHSVNNFCASGLTAIGMAANAVLSGQSAWALGGGVEMMSRVPFMADAAAYYTSRAFAAHLQYIPVALAADLIATREGFTRTELDDRTQQSQQRALAAEGDAALQASRIAVGGLSREENPRDLDRARLEALAPAFGDLAKEYAGPLDGTAIEAVHTVAHAPPMADGAGLALIGPRAGAIARIVAMAEVGGDPRESLTAGFAAMDLALRRAGLTLKDIDRIEFMEAFAVTIAKFLRDRDPDPAIVNVGGGHLAKGHPMGATGGILLSTLIDALVAADGRLGLVVVTGAQGIGSAMIVERI